MESSSLEGCSRFINPRPFFSTDSRDTPHMRDLPWDIVSGRASPWRTCDSSCYRQPSGRLSLCCSPGWARLVAGATSPALMALPTEKALELWPPSIMGLPLPAKVLKASGHRCGCCQPPGPISGNSMEENEDTNHIAVMFSQNMQCSQINVSPASSHHNIHMAHYWF